MAYLEEDVPREDKPSFEDQAKLDPYKSKGTIARYLLNEGAGGVAYSLSQYNLNLLANAEFTPSGLSCGVGAGDNTRLDKALFAGNFTFICTGNFVDIASTSALFGSRSNASSGVSFKHEQYNNTNKVGATFHGIADYSTAIDSPTGDAFYAFVINVADSTIDVYVNDEHDQLSVGVMSAPTQDGFVLGAKKSGSSYGDVATGEFFSACLIGRALSSSEVAVYRQRIYANLLPRKRYVWVPEEAGGVTVPVFNNHFRNQGIM